MALVLLPSLAHLHPSFSPFFSLHFSSLTLVTRLTQLTRFHPLSIYFPRF